MGFTCTVCGETHAGEMRDIRMSLPDPIFRIEEPERERRAWVGEDSAVLRDGDVRTVLRQGAARAPDREGGGLLRLRRLDRGERRPTSKRCGELWHDVDGWRSEPFPGTLANELLPYAFTEGLPVRIRLRDVKLLPLVELEDVDHELVRAQGNGISAHRAHELAATVA